MLSKQILRSWVPRAMQTSVTGSGLYANNNPISRSVIVNSISPKPISASAAVPAAVPVYKPVSYFAHTAEECSMPTHFVDDETLGKIDAGTGAPAQRGSNKPIAWKRRKPWFSKQYSLDLKRAVKGPETPAFPEGVPFTLIRKFQAWAGRSWKVNTGRRRRVRYSLKRGRKRLLKS